MKLFKRLCFILSLSILSLNVLAAECNADGDYKQGQQYGQQNISCHEGGAHSRAWWDGCYSTLSKRQVSKIMDDFRKSQRSENRNKSEEND